MEASDERRSATVVASDDRLSATVAARSDRSIDSKVCATLLDDYIWKVLQVLCTGSKPNSNACSMRGGECRHFASAFASARLALPGPEEKSIVSSTISIAADKSPFCGNQAHATTSS
ncbi:uncharacterized protein LOC114274479 isoform X5 [Camellia sinensis]|uniref:uncharacterized protein LOC114274479 isoform X5 n=1 Tax=Camellia sinensis TaxID=4442 RepID=UPI0010360955|nr:uncharacterized protein LOC114274479 isoform X5 [Camellia sinensis]